MDVELTDDMERSLEKLVDTGRYVSVEEAVEDAVRKHLARIEDSVKRSDTDGWGTEDCEV